MASTAAAVPATVALFCLYGGCTTFAFGYSHDEPVINTDARIEADLALSTTHIFMSLFVFLGLGVLFNQNSRFSWQAIGYSLAIGTTTVEWSILLLGFWANGKMTRNTDVSGWPSIPLNFTMLVNSLYIAASVLIAYSSLIGRVSFAQAYAVAFFQTFFVTANYIIALETKIFDAGATFSTHVFGAAFGLFASWAICNKLSRDVSNQARTKEAGAFALIGLIVLFVTFPVFNTGNIYYLVSNLSNLGVTGVTLPGLVFRGYFNTIASMASSIAAAFLVSKANSVNGDRFNLWQIQSAAIAGGAAVGAVGPYLRNPYGALMLGAAAGVVAVIAQTVITPALAKLRIHDTNGVLASHLLPGLIGGVASAIAAARATSEQGFAPASIAALIYDDRSAKQQGGYQIAFAAISLVFGIISGLFTGAVVNLVVFESKAVLNADDADEWDAIEAGHSTAIATTQHYNPVAEKVVSAPAPAVVEAPVAHPVAQ